MKTLITDDQPEPWRIWSHLNAAAAEPLNITYSFRDTAGAMTVLPTKTISVASGAAAANVTWYQF